MKTIEEIDEKPNKIIVVFVEAVLMPNGELIRNGKVIGWNGTEDIYKEV